MWYVYILECKNSFLYTGVTDNLNRRFEEHLQGQGGHYTSYALPEKIIYSEVFENELDAIKREKQIKGWTRVKKIALAEGKLNLLKRL